MSKCRPVCNCFLTPDVKLGQGGIATNRPLGDRPLEKIVSGLDAERERYIAMLAEDLERLVQQLSNMPEVRQVIVFGSYAAGRRDLLTDLDLLVV